MDNSASNPSNLISQSQPVQAKKLSLLIILISVVSVIFLLSVAGTVYLFWSERLIFIPMPGNQKEIFAYGISHSFTTKITALESRPDGIQLLTDSNIKALPKIIVSPKTDIFFVSKDNETFEQTIPSNLKPDQLVMVNIYYHLKSKGWLTTRINIFQ